MFISCATLVKFNAPFELSKVQPKQHIQRPILPVYKPRCHSLRLQTTNLISTIMAAIISHPANAMQAKAFTAPTSLSYPGGAGDLTPPSSDAEGQKAQQQSSNGNSSMQGQDAATGNAPATPAATPGGGPGVSGIVPTLQ